MKTISILLAIVWLGVDSLPAQTKPANADAPITYQEVERGPHHRVVASVRYEKNLQGEITATTNSYTEIATGLHYRDGDQWLPSEAKIEILPKNAGAVASRGQHKAIFPPEIKSGIIELQTPDNQWLRSRVWGLSYFDSATGQSVLIAEVKESEGQIVGDNVVIYPNAFTDFRADIRYTYTLAGFEQDVVLREQPPTPEMLGLNPKTTRLQVLTEFVEAPAPAKRSRQADGLADQSLGFGQMSIGSGKAFTVGTTGDAAGEVPVAKEWSALEGRDFLIEEVQYEKVVDQLQKLPAAGEYRGASLQRRGTGETVIAGLKKLMPKRYAKVAPKPGTKRMAKVSPKSTPGFVMDYVTLTSQTNYTFRGDTTYYVSGSVNLSGTNTTFEGGTVIKYAPTNTAKLNVTSPITWLGSAYRPVVMTARDDSTVGDSVTTTNALTGYYADTALFYDADTVGELLFMSNLRISYAKRAIYINKMTGHEISHAQFVNCQVGITNNNSTIILRNALMHNVLTNFVGSIIKAEHLTVDTANWLNPSGTLSLTNCLLVNVTNANSFTSNSVSVGTSSDFQTIGAGSHYLADNSAYRNAGTTNIASTLATDLRNRTTYPPILRSNLYTGVDTTFTRQAQRDTDMPDLGYHYDPIDYIAYDYSFTNCTVTIKEGAVIGYYDNNGFRLGSGATIYCEGTPTAMNRFVHHRTVQEQAAHYGSSPAGEGFPVSTYRSVGSAAPGYFRFTRFEHALAGSYPPYFFYNEPNWNYSSLSVQDCSFGRGIVDVTATGAIVSIFRNNLFESQFNTSIGYVFFYDTEGGGASFDIRNNTFVGGVLYFEDDTGAAQWTIRDNLMDSVDILDGGMFPVPHDHNAYVGTTLLPVGATDVVLTNLSFATGTLGDFYIQSAGPTIVNVGSRYATNAGLYHFTISTNQVKETSSMVDIGFHYVAVNGSGNPVDTDGDDLADYLEDANGNGVYDYGDIGDFNNADTDGNGEIDQLFMVYIVQPRSTTP